MAAVDGEERVGWPAFEGWWKEVCLGLCDAESPRRPSLPPPPQTPEAAAAAAELSAVRESVMSLRRPQGLEELCEGDYLRHGGGGPGEQAARSYL